MFCSLVDSNGFSPDPDAEEWHGLVGAFLQAASIAVTEWDGKVAEKLDDGLIAHFAYFTQESDLERAINAARVIQRSVAELNRTGVGKPTLAARIVIESGPTVVDRGGDSSGELSNPAMRPPAASARQRPQIAAPEEHTRKEGRSRTLSDGRPMNYHLLITRAIDALDKNPGKLAGIVWASA
jgi:class 3 adenylate cyclase